jgi:hypothetical protein
MVKFRRSRLSSIGLPSSALHLGRATSAWAVGASTDDVPILSTVGWVIRPWAASLMHYHPGLSGPAEGFVHGGYYTGTGHYGSVGHQQDKRAPSQENQMDRNTKPNGLVSLKIAAALGQQCKQWVPKDGPFADGSRGNQGQSRPRGETLANDGAKHDTEKGPEGVVAK